MTSEQISHIGDQDVHRPLENSQSATTNVANPRQTLNELDQGLSGLDDSVESTNVEATNQTRAIALPLPGEETVPATSTQPANTSGEQHQLDNDVPPNFQFDAQYELGHISVG